MAAIFSARQYLGGRHPCLLLNNDILMRMRCRPHAGILVLARALLGVAAMSPSCAIMRAHF